MSTVSIPGYTYGAADVPPSPIALEELELLKQSVLFTDDDVRYLRLARDVLADQVEDVLDVWYGFVASHPHLVYYFADSETGEPNAEYLERVRRRFGQWIIDTAEANYDQKWLDYQSEIARRHHRTAKNRTDGVDAVENISLRYVIALIYPITATLRPFLAKRGHGVEDVDAMHDAWRKAVILQVALWAHPYVRDGDW